MLDGHLECARYGVSGMVDVLASAVPRVDPKCAAPRLDSPGLKAEQRLHHPDRLTGRIPDEYGVHGRIGQQVVIDQWFGQLRWGRDAKKSGLRYVQVIHTKNRET